MKNDPFLVNLFSSVKETTDCNLSHGWAQSIPNQNYLNHSFLNDSLNLSEIRGNAWQYNAIMRQYVRDENYVILCGIVRDYAPRNCNISALKPTRVI